MFKGIPQGSLFASIYMSNPAKALTRDMVINMRNIYVLYTSRSATRSIASSRTLLPQQ